MIVEETNEKIMIILIYTFQKKNTKKMGKQVSNYFLANEIFMECDGVILNP